LAFRWCSIAEVITQSLERRSQDRSHDDFEKYVDWDIEPELPEPSVFDLSSYF
jgi:hypothetical protein